jgi:TonB family protein
VAPPQSVPLLERIFRRAVEREPDPEPARERDITEESDAKPAHKHHEIQVDLTPASSITRKRKSAATDSTASSEFSSSSTDSRRVRSAIASALDRLAVGVQTSGAQATVVDMPGQGGGEAFAGYETVIYNAYYHAWTTPDSIANRQAVTDVKIVVARDGTIVSAKIVNKSGERALDKSVERALDAVEKLPPFPAGAHDEERTFLIRFNLDAKEASG